MVATADRQQTMTHPGTSSMSDRTDPATNPKETRLKGTNQQGAGLQSVPPSLDDIFRRIVARQPHLPALIDPPDKRRVTGDAPSGLTFAEADRAISALAAQFIDCGLPVGSVVAVQLPNTVEFMLTVLAAFRAGLVVALLPQLWRQAEVSAALNRTSARAIVTMGSIDGVNHADLAMNAAVEAFSIRCVFGFGDNLPEGMTPLNPWAETGARFPVQDPRRAAVISFDVTPDGPRAIPRTHLHLIAGGLAVFLEAGIGQGATMLSAMQPSSFAGLTASLVAWLLSGGTLALHHPFDVEVLARQLAEEACATLVAPGPFVIGLPQTGMLQNLSALRQVIGLWRAPEQVLSSAEWRSDSASLTDVYLFGEVGLFGARRGSDGAPAQIQPGPHGAPREAAATPVAGETILTPRGTLALRGPMVPAAAYKPAAEAGGPALSAPAASDYVDTGYAARRDRANGALCITAPPSGVLSVGGYRFLSNDLQEWAKRLAQGTMLTALPDRMSGYRLAGRASDNARAREAMAALGLNPLMVEAFRDRAPAG
jgi:acyl-CoA synthetase (AMP-forming)/AMP-acid ligase II